MTDMSQSVPRLVKSDEGIWLMFDQGHYVRTATAEERLFWALLRDIAESGVEFDDDRIPYVSVQIDRDVWDRLRSLARGSGGPSD